MSLLDTINQGIQQDQLLERAAKASERVSAEADKLTAVPGITGFRTSGTSLWVDTNSHSTT